MTENLDLKTFDLASVLAGRGYPEREVSVYFDEKLGDRIWALKAERDAAQVSDDSERLDELQKELDALIESAKSAEYKVTLRGIPEVVRNNIFDEIEEEFPAKRNIIGQVEPNPAADRAYTRKLWAAMIVKLTDPDGGVAALDEAAVKSLQDFAPAMVLEDINSAVTELTKSAKQGFEYAAQEVDFLSNASREG